VVMLLAWCVGLERCDIGEVCPKCLQEVGTRKWTMFGLPVHRKTVVHQKIGVPRHSAFRGPETPQIDAGMYEQITGQKCDHDLVIRWFGRTSGGFLFQIHADGGSTKWPLVQPWAAATEALYTAFARTHDQQSAAALCEIIVESYNYIEYSEVTRKVTAQLAGEADANETESRAIIAPLEKHAPEAGVMAHKILELRRLTERLRAIETVEDLRAVRRDFVGGLGHANRED